MNNVKLENVEWQEIAKVGIGNAQVINSLVKALIAIENAYLDGTMKIDEEKMWQCWENYLDNDYITMPLNPDIFDLDVVIDVANGDY